MFPARRAIRFVFTAAAVATHHMWWANASAQGLTDDVEPPDATARSRRPRSSFSARQLDILRLSDETAHVDVVKAFLFAQQPAGHQFVTWDGRGDDGTRAPAGRYAAHVRAFHLTADGPVGKKEMRVVRTRCRLPTSYNMDFDRSNAHRNKIP